VILHAPVRTVEILRSWGFGCACGVLVLHLPFSVIQMGSYPPVVVGDRGADGFNSLGLSVSPSLSLSVFGLGGVFGVHHADQPIAFSEWGRLLVAGTVCIVRN